MIQKKTSVLKSILKYTFLLGFIFCGLISSVIGQTDSLLKVLTQNIHDSVRVNTMLKIGYILEKSEIDKSLEWYKKAIDKAQTPKLEYYHAKALNYCAVAYLLKSDFKEAQNLFLKELLILEKQNNKKDIAGVYGNLGLIEKNQGNYSDAASYFMKIIYLQKELKDTIGEAKTYANLGMMFRDMSNFKDATEYLIKAVRIFEKTRDKKFLAAVYVNLGIVFNDQKNYTEAEKYFTKSLKEYDAQGNQKGLSVALLNFGDMCLKKNDLIKAFALFEQSLEIKREIKDKRGIAMCLSNLGIILMKQKKFDAAEKNFLQALAIKKEMDLKKGVAATLNNLAELQIQKCNYSKALNYAEEALEISVRIGALNEQLSAINGLVVINKNMGKYIIALQLTTRYDILKDSIFNIEKSKQITEIDKKYQSEKKQLEIDKLAKEKELQSSEMKKQRVVILLVVCGLLFVVIVSIVLFRMFLIKKKANKIITDKNIALQIAHVEINSQKEEIIVQRDNLQQQKEIIEEHQKEISDSINYALRIQRAVMPEAKQLQHILSSNETGVLNREYFILFKPKDIVSGDFYWTTRIGDMLIITVADCTGHGVPGAFMSMLGISFLNEIVRKKEITKSSEVLNHLRTNIIEALKQNEEYNNYSSQSVKDGMDISLCAINTQTLEMQFAGANNPLWIFRTLSGAEMTELVEIKGDKQPIGIYENMKPFTNHIVQLKMGDSIYLMSDGYEDQFGGPNRKKFLAKNLKNIILKNCQLSMIEQKNILENNLYSWINSGEQIDDITIVGIKI